MVLVLTEPEKSMRDLRRKRPLPAERGAGVGSAVRIDELDGGRFNGAALAGGAGRDDEGVFLPSVPELRFAFSSFRPPIEAEDVLGVTRYLRSFSRSTTRSSIPSSSLPSPKDRPFLGRRITLVVGRVMEAVEEEDVGRAIILRTGERTPDVLDRSMGDRAPPPRGTGEVDDCREYGKAGGGAAFEGGASPVGV